MLLLPSDSVRVFIPIAHILVRRSLPFKSAHWPDEMLNKLGLAFTKMLDLTTAVTFEPFWRPVQPLQHQTHDVDSQRSGTPWP